MERHAYAADQCAFADAPRVALQGEKAALDPAEPAEPVPPRLSPSSRIDKEATEAADGQQPEEQREPQTESVGRSP